MKARPSGQGRLLRVVAALGAVAFALAAAPPEVVRVRVPSSRVSSYFPSKTTLRTLSGDQFEALVADASAAARASEPTASRRPVRVEHSARWVDGTLVGRSRVTLPSTLEGPAIVACDPWSPALLDSEDRPGFVRVDRSGRLILVQAANQPERVVELRWRQAAQADSLGRAFPLRLPDADVATLAIDLPADMAPSAIGGNPVSPDPSRWEFVGASGWFPIMVRSKSTVDWPWVGGSTRVDLNATGANWVANWRVERNALSPGVCRIDLDDGLELVDVSGPEVKGFRLEPASGPIGSGRRVEVALLDPDPRSPRGTSTSTSITIRGQVQAPLEGAWLVPSARPANAGWLGGRTEVKLDPSRVATACVERSGRRVPARPDESSLPSTWIFESDGRPGPLAELRLDRPRGDASVEVEGTLRVGSFAPRVEVVATWTAGLGRLFDPTLELPRGWVVDRVVGTDGRSDATWRVEPTADGPQRVHFDPTLGVSGDNSPGRAVSLRVSATRIDSASDPLVGPMALPRVRPPAGPARVASERWVAQVEPGWELEPTSTRGLAWVDPSPLGPPPTPPTRGDEGVSDPEPPQVAPGQMLAWRWVDDDAEATVIRKRAELRPRLDDRLEATIAGGRLRLVWVWTIAEAARPATLAFHVPLDPTVALRWRLVDRSVGSMIEPSPLDLTERAAVGFPSTGTASEILLAQLPPGGLTIRGEAEVAWSGSGSIPLSQLPVGVEARRSVVLRVEDAARFRVDRAEGLTPVARGGAGDLRLPGAEAESSPFRAIVGDDEVGLRVAAAWLGDGGPGRLDVSTALDLGPGEGGAIVTEASLTSRLAPGSEFRHRLNLRVAPGLARTLTLTMPEGSKLDRVRRDGQAAVASVDGASLRVNLALTDPSRPTSTITLEYRTPFDVAQTRRIAPSGLLPTVGLPCLSFTWQVNAPERFSVWSESTDLLDTDLARPVVTNRWSTLRPKGLEAAIDKDAEASVDLAMLVDLDRALAVASPVETTLGDWLVKLDAGRWPLVLDRLALQSVGWGPKSRINVVDLDPRRPLTASAVLGTLGLQVEPIGATFLVSTEGTPRGDLTPSATAFDGEGSREALFQAAIVGSDRSDRYQSPSRWRGEPTPRAWLASETPDRGLVALGWQSHRFAASGWPSDSTAILFDDPRASARQLGLIAAGLVVTLAFAGASRMSKGRRRVLIVPALALMATWTASARFDPVEPIIAILPYDDLDGLDAKPGRVVLRQEDHDRLVQLARPSRPEPAKATLVAATHHVARPNGRSVVVESRYMLEVVGPVAAAWTFPVGSAFDLEATIDGHPSPLVISPDGRSATLAAIPPGRPLVVFRRSVPWVESGREGGVGGSIRVSVDRSAFALVEVDRVDGPGLVDLPDLAGIVQPSPDGLVGELGPSDRIAVRWGASPPGASRPEVDATIRWDAHPAGDRVIARLTVVGKTPLRSVRLATGPGLAVVGQTIPGLVGTATAGSSEQPEWVAHVDPPLGPGTSFEVTLWRPVATPEPTRSFPRLGLVGGELTGLVGFRKPDGWSGRLSNASSADLLSELNFVRRWGPMTTDGLSLAGASWWDGSRAIVARVAPEPVKLDVRDQVAVEVVAGGLKFAADSVLIDKLAPSWDAEATFDGPVRLVRVEANGLSSWTQPRPDRVRLVFDGSKPIRERAIHLEGIVGGPRAPTAGEGGEPASSPVPWPRWAGVDPNSEAEPGKLVVEGEGEFRVASKGEILLEDPSQPPPPSAKAPGRTRKTYSRRRLDPASRVEWTTPRARVNVSVQSDLRLDPTRSHWTADVVCEVSGGSARTLYWKLPTAWALGASLTTDGAAPRVEAETRGESTFWTITLDRPTWNRRTLTIRSSRPLVPGAAIDYPEVAPLSMPGRGEVARYDLAVTQLSGVPVALEAASGVTSLATSSDRSNPTRVPGGALSRAFRVSGNPWSIRLRVGTATAVEPPLRPGQFDDSGRLARVERVDLQVAIDRTTAQGRAEVRLRPGSPFLPVFLAPGARLIGASVEGRATTPIGPDAGGDRRWLIPLGDRDARRVVFGWTQPAPMSGQARPDGENSPSAPLPRFEQPSMPTSIRVTSPAAGIGWTISGGGTWASLNPMQASLARFERLGDEVREATERVNREPTSARSVAILDPLIEMALNLRAARRSLQVADQANQPKLDEWLAIQDRGDALILEAGLGSLLEETKERVGLVPPGPEPGRNVGFEEAPDIYRIRPIGQPYHFRGLTSPDPTQPPALEATPEKLSHGWNTDKKKRSSLIRVPSVAHP